MAEKKWSPDILNKLIEASGKTYDQIAADAGIGRSTLNKIINHRYPASADILITLANYFGVTTDFLCGQVSDEVLADILIVYPEYFTGLLRCSYEKSLESSPRKIPAGYISIWPYNLLDDVFQEPVSFVMTDDRIDGLYNALDMLSDREKEWTILSYRDGKANTEIAEMYDRSSNRVMQVLHKAVRKLRHPARKRLIMDGVNGSREIAEEREMISDQKRKLIQERMELEGLRKDVEDLRNRPPLPPLDPLDAYLNIAELDLSVRSFNCLMRADFKTMRELLKCATEGNLPRIRNFGVKSIKELLQKLYDMGYITYDQAVDYAEANKVNQFETAPWSPMVHERKEGIA